jgi:hypothetical protein
MPRSWLSELKIPAEPDFIPVAKRVAVSLGSKLGFNLDELDELSIAVSQSCDSAIAASQEAWGDGATLKLSYAATDRGIEVEIQALAPRAATAHVRRRAATLLQMQEFELQRMAIEMIRLFVDDFNSQVDAGAGRVRFKMRKYLVS